MSEYKLNIKLSDEALQSINEHNKMVLVKKDNTTHTEGVAWYSNEPYGQSNVDWEREYEVLASTVSSYNSNLNNTPLGGVISPEVMNESNSGETVKNNTGIMISNCEEIKRNIMR